MKFTRQQPGATKKTKASDAVRRHAGEMISLESSEADPFYSPANIAVLEKSIQDAEAGKLTIHELIEK